MANIYHQLLKTNIPVIKVCRWFQKCVRFTSDPAKEFQPPKKSVKFNIEGERDDSPCDHKQPININHERDTSIYRSYCAIKHFMDAISFCSEIEMWKKFQKAKKKKHSDASVPSCAQMTSESVDCSNFSTTLSHLSKRSTSIVSMSGSSSQGSSRANFSRPRSISTLTTQTTASLDSANALNELTSEVDLLQDTYEQRVTQSLVAGKNHLSKIYPLTYRMEVFENLFSLLFTTHEDVQEMTSPGQLHWDSGDEDAEDKRRSWDSQRDADGETSLLSSLPESVTPVVPLSPVYTDDVDLLPQDHTDTRKDSQVKNEDLNLQFQEHDPKEHSSGLEGRKRGSGPGSTNSNASTSNMYAIGFVANEFIVRDVLHILKELLVDISAEMYTLHIDKQGLKSTEHKDPVIEHTKKIDLSLSECVNCSIEPGNLQGRVSRLTQCVSEALWRFQLVSHDHVPKEVGKVPTDLNTLPDSDSEDYGQWFSCNIFVCVGLDVHS